MIVLCENGLVKRQCYMKMATQYIKMILLYIQLYTSTHHYRNESITTHTKTCYWSDMSLQILSHFSL